MYLSFCKPSVYWKCSGFGSSFPTFMQFFFFHIKFRNNLLKSSWKSQTAWWLFRLTRNSHPRVESSSSVVGRGRSSLLHGRLVMPHRLVQRARVPRAGGRPGRVRGRPGEIPRRVRRTGGPHPRQPAGRGVGRRRPGPREPRRSGRRGRRRLGSGGDGRVRVLERAVLVLDGAGDEARRVAEAGGGGRGAVRADLRVVGGDGRGGGGSVQLARRRSRRVGWRVVLGPAGRLGHRLVAERGDSEPQGEPVANSKISTNSQRRNG